MRTTIFAIIISVLSFTFNSWAAKFLPRDNKILLILGQDLGAIGGFDAPNNDGYHENVGITAGGITTYTGIPKLGGLKTLDNWGAGDVCAQYIIDSPIYKKTALAIGLSMKNHITNIKNGDHDDKIIELGHWIRDAKRPVYVRIGYEFNGGWNNYNPQQDFIAAFKRVVDIWRRENVTNFATVWQSSGYESSDPATLMNWYPGDDYVDWLGYSHFHSFSNGAAMLSLAKSKNKPIMIAEVTPKGFRISDPNTSAWNDWFRPFFSHVHNNKEHIRAIAYINVNWDSQPMWAGQGWGDTRVEANETVLANWKQEINKDIWLNSSNDLFYQLGFTSSIRTPNSGRGFKETIQCIPSSRGSITISGLNAPSTEVTLLNLQGKSIDCTLCDNVLTPNTAIASGLYFLAITRSNGVTNRIKFLYSQP